MVFLRENFLKESLKSTYKSHPLYHRKKNGQDEKEVGAVLFCAWRRPLEPALSQAKGRQVLAPYTKGQRYESD